MPAPGYLNWSRKAKRRSGFNLNMNGLKKLKTSLTPRPLMWLRLYHQLKKIDMQKLKSRKLWAAIIGSVIVSAGPELGLSPEVTQWIAQIVIGYVVGQGIADAGQAVLAK